MNRQLNETIFNSKRYKLKTKLLRKQKIDQTHVFGNVLFIFGTLKYIKRKNTCWIIDTHIVKNGGCLCTIYKIQKVCVSIIHEVLGFYYIKHYLDCKFLARYSHISVLLFFDFDTIGILFSNVRLNFLFFFFLFLFTCFNEKQSQNIFFLVVLRSLCKLCNVLSRRRYRKERRTTTCFYFP